MDLIEIVRLVRSGAGDQIHSGGEWQLRKKHPAGNPCPSRRSIGGANVEICPNKIRDVMRKCRVFPNGVFRQIFLRYPLEPFSRAGQQVVGGFTGSVCAERHQGRRVRVFKLAVTKRAHVSVARDGPMQSGRQQYSPSIRSCNLHLQNSHATALFTTI
jgi:hypothetical protein